jgi:hypothetical protein
VNIKIGNYQLAGDGSDSVSDFSIENTSRIQIVEGIRRLNVLPIDRGNVRTVVSFKVTRKFETIDQAESFILSHGNTNVQFVGQNGMAKPLTAPNAIPRSGLVTIQSGTVNGRRTLLFFRATAIETVQSSFIGLTTMHRYTMMTGQIKKKAVDLNDTVP